MKIAFTLLFLMSTMALAQEVALTKKLVDGSPWRFSTRYESTVHEFRLTDDGKLQRMSSGTPGVWVDVAVSDKNTYEYQTMNGHVITFYVDRQGRASARHSKHPSDFKSLKE